jgi:hypothetical protein
MHDIADGHLLTDRVYDPEKHFGYSIVTMIDKEVLDIHRIAPAGRFQFHRVDFPLLASKSLKLSTIHPLRRDGGFH